ncbi:hypothetical protein immuto35A_221 [Flavobacterium phage vB_FspM_immuto_3-5A]|uniref:Uncharacterized protein n=1 Tax=Flavobacterium phage vB_FspM_immuto_2-6A TaxID=2801477 RepID=A0A7T8ERL3_9CAUD|nr:hypothetical protein KNV73_gp049 [Flavobacterium phage vB_FspM_immuto_2-6A]QQO91901.1 hypothetical protein immuto26A_222 [Flavobacterium phage vB_FspM_immuto_2-6A]QQO92139.1 hypothetical protein immuto35A_221 [Flavobacterium phage vB_FspM_immuto_3-5A]QQO92377.1 hypothetical protein immuto136C_221 [Flavobacterium phage vB_FspM_immuto_13-6C]
MAVAQGYGKTVTSGSVFAYDTGDTRNSYRGRPTVNYIAHHNAMPQTSYNTYTYTTSGTWPAKHPLAIRAYNAQGSEISAYVNAGVGDWTNKYHAHWQYDPILKKPVTVMQASDSSWKAKNFGTGMAAWASLGMSAGQQYVISWDQYTTDINLCADAGFYSRNGSGTAGFHDGRSYGSAKNTLLNTWQRVYYNFTVNATRNLNDSTGLIFMYGHTTSNSGGTLKIANVQLELGVSVPSPYIDHTSAGLSSTRSSTQGLLPLVGNSTVDLTNVSFDSNAQIAFDGTNDSLIINDGILSGYERSVEYVVKFNTISGTYEPIAAYTYGTGAPSGRIWLGLQNISGYKFRWHGWGTDDPYSSTNATTGQYYHIVNTYNYNTRKMGLYVNGVDEANDTYDNQSGFSAWSDTSLFSWHLGYDPYAYGGVTNSNIELPAFKTYNRELSAAEVRQNYLHYKTRFNLS